MQARCVLVVLCARMLRAAPRSQLAACLPTWSAPPACAQGRREDLKSVVENLRKRYGVQYVYCWHGESCWAAAPDRLPLHLLTRRPSSPCQACAARSASHTVLSLVPGACPAPPSEAGLSAYWSGVSPTAPAMAKYEPSLHFPTPTPGLSEIEPRWVVAEAARVCVWWGLGGRPAEGARAAGQPADRDLPGGRMPQPSAGSQTAERSSTLGALLPRGLSPLPAPLYRSTAWNPGILGGISVARRVDALFSDMHAYLADAGGCWAPLHCFPCSPVALTLPCCLCAGHCVLRAKRSVAGCRASSPPVSASVARLPAL